jgi:hypothetical protein
VEKDDSDKEIWVSMLRLILHSMISYS